MPRGKIWVKYHLKKDGSPVWDGFETVQAAQAAILRLKDEGYNPVIDRKQSNQHKKG
ncbi:MAG TPA: hypothetical protein PLE99_05600 [Candidatus Thiothrix moscowensis]|uniref:hypothetical protein n=1 Tax=unclassified Thiothrix TaxID=2636184 RepID=UPI0025CFC9DC|nr:MULTISPECIES: hypothetical protein [unclassified Thiothrix]HRJ52218.1 hypothetical protein [Candidatus Thiothrix moscowensis]HRJ92533.1 hypothetical protein [Candidatus Thiothrix moscowensis]